MPKGCNIMLCSNCIIRTFILLLNYRVIFDTSAEQSTCAEGMHQKLLYIIKVCNLTIFWTKFLFVKSKHCCEIRRLSGETIFVDIIKEEFERFVEEDDDDHFLLVKKNAADSDGGCVTRKTG